MRLELGQYYEFHQERNIARPGVEPRRPGGADLEIGPAISRERALSRVRGGGDIYTLSKTDAFEMARQLGEQARADIRRRNPDAKIGDSDPRRPTDERHEPSVSKQ